MKQWRFEVFNRPGFSDVRGKSVLEDITELGISSVEAVQSATVFLIEADFNKDFAGRLAKELLFFLAPVLVVVTRGAEFRVVHRHVGGKILSSPRITPISHRAANEPFLICLHISSDKDQGQENSQEDFSSRNPLLHGLLL